MPKLLLGRLGSRYLPPMRALILTATIVLGSLVMAQPLVVVTTSQLGDIARNVAGDLAEVRVLMGPGVDPHLYRATPRDVQNLQLADLIIYHGLGLEGQLAEVLDRFATMTP